MSPPGAPPPGAPPPAAGWPAPGAGWPPPGYSPLPPRRGNGKVIGIVAGALAGVVLLCGGAGLLVFLLSASNDPVTVVDDYFVAAERGDCETMIDLVTESTWREGGVSSRRQAIADCDEGMSTLGGGIPISNSESRLISERGDTAVVATTVTAEPLDLGLGLGDAEPQTSEIRITLRKEGRTWLIDGNATDDFGVGI